MSDPFLKWPGGKRWLVSSDQLPKLPKFDRYIEPFLGGGAMFFHLRPDVALLSDLNSDLIELYEVMRDHPRDLRSAMADHQALHAKDHYYAVRGSVPVDPVGRAARFLYLNRTCWNGLYRVNLRGEFNVPIGTKSAVLTKDDDFSLISAALQNHQITCCDFEETVDNAGLGDLLFVDPPYTVQHNMNGFVKYNEKIFQWADQIRLRDAVSRAANRGAAVIVTNADHSCIQTLYSDVGEYSQLTRATVLAGAGGRRGATSEALFVANLSL